MAEDELIFRFDAQGAAAFERAVRGVEGTLRDLDDSIDEAKESAVELYREIEALNRKARLDQLKSESEEFAKAMKRAELAQDRLRKSMAGAESASTTGAGATKRWGESMATTANQALQLVRQTIELGRAVHEFAMKGVDAQRVAAQYGGQLDNLRAATGNSIDDTTLMRLDLMARKTGLWGEQIDAVARLSLKFAREEGKEMVDVFEQMKDASPEQLEKWGILTSDMVAKLQGLDTVQQKQALRQELVNAGMRVTNEEIAAQTHALERASAKWDNWVSGLQVAAAEALESEGANHAFQTMSDSIDEIGTALTDAAERLGWFVEKMAEPLGVEDVGVAEFFDLFWYATVIGPILLASKLYNEFVDAMTSGLVVNAAADVAKEAAKQKGMTPEEVAAMTAEFDAVAATVAPTRNAKDAARTEWWEQNDGFDFTNDSSITSWQNSQYNRRGRKKKNAPNNTVAGAFGNTFLGTSTGWGGREGGVLEGALGSTGFVDGLSLEGNRGGDMITGIGGGLGMIFESAVGPAGEFASALSDISEEMERQREEAEKTRKAVDRMVEGTAFGIEELSRIGELSKRSIADQVAAYAGLGSQGVQAVGQFAQAMGASQKDMAWIRGGVETFETAASLGRYDFWGAGQHAAAAAGAFAVAGGAFDSRGGGGGTAGRSAGGAAPGAGVGPSTFGPGANLDRASDREDRTVVQFLVNRQVMAEGAIGGANEQARTYRRSSVLDAQVVSPSAGASFP